jgi:hypothetical protein
LPSREDNYWSNGKVDIADRWETSSEERKSLAETIADIGSNNSLVILKHVEQDPIYAPVLQDFLAKIIRFSGPRMRSDVTVGEVLILISSPNRITAYHMDAECNFLVQVVGNKTISIFDQKDRGLVPLAKIEAYHAGDYNSIVYDESRQPEAKVVELLAGEGVHIPVFAPHWVQNHNNISVALSVNYELKSVNDQARICRFNRFVGKLGIVPMPPGMSPRRDGIKLAMANAATAIRDKVKPRTYRVWTPPTNT